MISLTPTRYDTIGRTYSRTRREDPELANLLMQALGDARSVVNVGAGSGSYEPRDRHVVAVEPSDVMAAQRAADLAPALRASAGELPLRDDSVGGALAVLTIHHWGDELVAGLRELRRVARGPVVIVTYDAEVSREMWIAADYMPEVAELDRRVFPAPGRIGEILGGETRITPVPIGRDTPDWTFSSFWAHPERVLDAGARDSTSGFALMPPEVVARVEATVRRDLEDGTWDDRHGHLRELPAYDCGMRLIVNHPVA